MSDSRIRTKRDELVTTCVAYKTVEINSNSKMTMEALPMEVLTHILQYLSPIDRLRSEQVCRIWRDASRRTWRDVETLYIIKPDKFDYYDRFRYCNEPHELVEKENNRLFIGTDSPKINRCLISRVGYFIKKLIFDYRYSKNYRVILLDINNYCHNLRIFEIGPAIDNDDDELFSRLSECNKELHSIKCNQSYHFIEALPLRDWKSLRLGVSRELNEGKIVSLIEHSEALEEFGIQKFTKPIVESLLKCHNLKSLHFTNDYGASIEMIFDIPLLNRLMNLSIYGKELDMPLLCNMLQHCCQLKSLKMAAFDDDIPVKLLETISALPVLETLEFHSNSITDDKLIHLIKVKNLCLVDVYGERITHNGILQLVKKSEILEKLDIRRIILIRGMFELLVGQMNDRSKYLELMVNYDDFEEASEICAGSKIRVVREMQCFKN